MSWIHSQNEKVDMILFMLMKKKCHLLTIHLLAVGCTDLTVYVRPLSIHHGLLQYRKTVITIHHLSRSKGTIIK